ncbi:MAG: DUF58 domain-containing protein [Myxococcales bacterium]|nr:DUF58 domain-containing protein [Myxococcales bacterium]
MRVTRDGWLVLAGATGLAVVAWLSANNLLYLVASPVWAALLVSVPLGASNLAGLSVRRVLPAELYAGRDSPGRLLVRCPGRRFAALDLVVTDEGTGAVGHIQRIGARTWGEVSVRWRFGQRGAARLSAVWVRSTFPFGLMEHRRRLALAADLLVYPRPHPSVLTPRASWEAGSEDDHRSGGAGDFLELRPYQPGDSIKRVHWPTTARLGQLLVVERAAERAPAVEVVVAHAASGAVWERELSRACGEIQRALAQGYRVGLRVPAVDGSSAARLAPARGGQWRRTLLDTLARLPRLP